jgi:hypothetical protein
MYNATNIAQPVRVVAKSAIPVIYLPSGTITSTDGQMTLPSATMNYIPAGPTQIFCAASGGLTYGIMYATWGGTTAAPTLQVYTDAAMTTKPVTTVGAYTATTGGQTIATINMPAGTMGKNSSLRITIQFGYTNSANNKIMYVSFGGTYYLTYTQANAGNYTQEFIISIDNCNSTSLQCGSACYTPSGIGTSGQAETTSTVDTTAVVPITILCNRAVATDEMHLRKYTIEVLRDPSD